MENKKFNHAEAFYHMVYTGKSNTGSITIKIWNSRDGVTPFMTFSKEYGIELQCRHTTLDYREQNYKPKKGDLIWRDTTPEEEIEFAGKSFDTWQKMLDEGKDLESEHINHLKTILEPGRDEVIKTLISSMNKGEPFLELVKNDWV